MVCVDMRCCVLLLCCGVCVLLLFVLVCVVYCVVVCG